MTAAPSVLVGIQPTGSKPPIYWVHPGSAGSEGFERFERLAHLLGREQPSFGIRAVWAPTERFESIANALVRQIVSFQSVGPYFLAGFREGAVVAYELARQLSERGHDIGVLVSVHGAARDVNPGRAAKREDSLAALFRVLAHRQRRLLDLCKSAFVRQAEKGGRHTKPKLVSSRHSRSATESLHALAEAEPEFAEAPDPESSGDTVQAGDAASRPAPDRLLHQQWTAPHVLQPYPGTLTLFRARDERLPCADLTLGWGTLALGGVVVNVLPGTAEQMLTEPNVRILAAELKACLAEGHARCSGAIADPKGRNLLQHDHPEPQHRGEPLPKGVVT